MAHRPKDGWRVRQVEAPLAQSVASSQQTTSVSTTPTSATSGADGGKTVRRVSQPLIFDLREGSEEGSGSIRGFVEFFRVDTDDEDEDEQVMVVNTVREEWTEQSSGEEANEAISIIVNSGVYASLFPGHLMNRGKAVKGAPPHLQDAQGTKIDIVLTSSEGTRRERATFCDVVSRPILSFGRLTQAGWSID